MVGASATGRGKEDATFILKDKYSRLGTNEMLVGNYSVLDQGRVCYKGMNLETAPKRQIWKVYGTEGKERTQDCLIQSRGMGKEITVPLEN